jgi:Ca-activated chloride channel homolog
VTGPDQRLVTGLSRDNFRVYEGKKMQEIRDFSSEDVPVSIGLIVDTSGSMKDKMERVRDAVNSFCDAANLQDEFFMITFADKPRLATDFTLVPSDLQNELILTKTGGRTALLDAIYWGLEKMRGARYAKKALLVISDGGDNHSRFGEREVKAAAKESDTLIYSIGIFDHYVPTLEEELGPQLLSEIAEPTGGRAFTVDDVSALPSVAHRISEELRTQYVIGFRPEKAPHDGKWHKLKVKLRRLPNQVAFLRVHAKPGYYAEKR